MADITDKQNKAIGFIEYHLYDEPKFTGKTRAEASKYIGKYLDDAKHAEKWFGDDDPAMFGYEGEC